MFPDSFDQISLIQKKRGVLVYRAKTDDRSWILKAIEAKTPAIEEAFRDEYSHLCVLSHPNLPAYYGMRDDFVFPGMKEHYLTICMEDCTPLQPVEMSSLSFPEIIRLIIKIGECLLYLLMQGILYTDLNPSNVLISRSPDLLTFKLIDYTYCYYFKNNPHPSYSLRFSYNVDPDGGGQHMLIQELSYLLHEYIQQNPAIELSSTAHMIMQTGLKPPGSLTLPDYLNQLAALLS